MFSSFFIVAIRVFIRDRIHTLINIFGLAIGLAFSLVIFLYAHKEISYDRFHDNARRIYRVVVKGKIAENILNHAVTAAPLARTMIREIPEVEDATRIALFGAWLVRYGNVRYNEDNIIFTDPNFFQFFSFPLIRGKAEDVLSKPKSIVLSRQTAQRYFGNEDPVGKMLQIENDSTYYEVTGIMENIPENSHLHFDMVGTLSTFEKLLKDDRWIAHYLYTYFLSKQGTTIEKIDSGLQRIASGYVLPDYQKLLGVNDQKAFSDTISYSFISQPLTDIHLKSAYAAEFEPGGNMLYINLFIALAIIILILSCLNFISLVTAQSYYRAREVGIRKIAGSERNGLMRQFLLESSLLTFFAMALALLFTELALPAFSNYIGLHLSLGQLLNTAGIILMVALIIGIGLISGLYPAWYLSSYNPGSVMHKSYVDHREKGRFRTGLALFQIFLAIGALTMTLIILFQFRYLVNKDRGYDTENLVVIRRPDGLTNKLEDYKERIIRHPGVISVTNTTSALGNTLPRSPYFLEGDQVTHNYSFSQLLVSFGFDSTYRIRMSSGRFFNRNEPGDSLACVINETAARRLGIDHPIGKSLIQLTGKPNKKFTFKIVGVVKDFHFETLENPIRPLIIILMPGNFEGYLTVRMTPENQDTTVQHLKAVWDDFTTAYPFVYYFLEKDKQAYYLPVRTTARIFTLLSVVTILMACLGLFALVSFFYHRRQREIGIQKAMGASKANIILRNAGKIILLVLIASPPAWIGVYYLANAWFKDYAYHIHMNFLFFTSATLVVILLSLATVYYHTCQAARINPGRTLNYE
jgi:putative ABC transport system permease protein